MRRAPSEWLLVPVFVLPVALAAGALLVVRTERETARDVVRADGAAAARRWLDEDPGRAAWLRTRFDDWVAALARGCAATPFQRGDVAGRIVGLAPAATDGASWRVATAPPSGLRAAALQDTATRLAIETGTPIARSPGADEGTAAFGAFVRAPGITALRDAPLTAAVKRYLLPRCADATPADASVVSHLRDVEDLLGASDAPPPPGSHAVGRSLVLVPTDGAPVTVAAAETVRAHLSPMTVCDDPSGAASLVWSPVPADGAQTPLWRGDLGRPLAGTWTIVERDDGRWLSANPRARWALAVAVACVAFLAVPSALLVSLRRRRRLDEARARFVNEIAHDLRTPVAALRLHADLLASGRVPEADRRKHEEVVGREAARLSSLLGNLLDLSRLERGARPFERSVVSVPDVLRDVLREFGGVHPHRAADVTIECPPGLEALADRSALARILANLLDNAGKFTDAGTPIRVRAATAGVGGVRLAVEDDGPGVPAAERERIFRVYERGSAATRTAAPGTGLGLALVRDLAAGMGGTAAIAPSPRGTTFEVVLPGGRRD